MKRFSEKLSSLTLSERINYPTIILTKLFDVFTAPTQELWMENIRRLHLAIPDPWKDKAFGKAIDTANKAVETTMKELESWNGEGEDEEEVYDVDYGEYYEDVLTAILNLFHRLGILVKPIVKEVIP